MGAADLEIDEADVEPIGTVEQINSDVGGDDVYALDGIDPARIVVMRAAAGSGSEYVLYARGELEYTSALCSYFRDLPSDCS